MAAGILSAAAIDTEGIVAEDNRMTTVKTRFATKVQQLLRVDREDSRPIKERTQAQILDHITRHISKWDAVVLSDYCKGVFENPDFVRRIIRICNDNHVIVTIDSKSRHIDAFENADFVKPNNLELENAVNIEISDLESLDRAGKVYLERSRAKSIIVTRGAEGISIFERGSRRRDYASKAVQVFDVTGAGDTVISTVTLGLASGLSLDDAVVLANIAAGVVIGKRGTAVVTKEELWRDYMKSRTGDKIISLEQLERETRRAKAQGKTVVSTSGCFDILHAGHVTYLEEARARGDMLIVLLNSDRSVRALKGSTRPIVPEEEGRSWLPDSRVLTMCASFRIGRLAGLSTWYSRIL